jgi:hypothetical protein
MAQNCFIHTADFPTFEAAAQAANASSWHAFPMPSGRFCGVVRDVDRFRLRSQTNATLLPPAHSSADVTSHAQALGFPNAKTARALYAAAFTLTNADMFDPDL